MKKTLHFYNSSGEKACKRVFLLLLLTMSANLALASSAFSTQTKSFNIQNATIKEAIKQVLKESKFNLIYSVPDMEMEQKVTLTINNTTEENALKMILKETGLIYSIKDNNIIISKAPATQQKITVKGKVIEADSKKPIAGATVLVAGTQEGAITDEKGAFTLQMKAGSEIEISFLGMQAVKMKFTTSNDNAIISMEKDVLAVDDVVVNGYYSRSKESLTGSAVVVTAKDLEKVSTQNLIGALQIFDPSFRVTDNVDMGSNPNALPDFRIRGNSGLGLVSEGSLKGSPNLPTFILDGYEVKVEKIYDLDLNRIESVTILKDASATAIYGSRAANGVVVVTTKAPKPGKLTVSYNFTGTIQAPDLSDYNLLNAADKLKAEVYGGRYELSGNYPDLEQQLRMDYAERERMIREGTDTYWLSQPLQSSFGHKHSLYIDGGDESVRYALDVNYQGNPGVMKDSKRDRFGAGLQLSYDLKGKLLFRNYLTVSKIKSNESSYGSFKDYARMNPYYKIYDENGNLYEEYTQNVNSTDRIYNPLYQSTLNNVNKSSYFEWTNNFDFDWKIIESLRLKARIAYTEKYDKTYMYKSPRMLEFTKYEYQEGEGVMKKGAAESGNTQSTSWDGNVVLSYNKFFGKHSLNAVVGGNMIENIYETESYKVRGFANEVLDRPSFANYFDGTAPDGEEGKTRLAGAFSNINYAYDSKYLVDLTFRLDGSSIYGAEKRSAPFYSVGIGWNIHKEKFFGKGEIVNNLKVTANMGTSGKASFEPYEAQTSFQYNREQWYATSVGATLMAMGNSRLEWEKTLLTDIRLEVGLLNNLISFSGNYYIKDTKDLLSDVTLPYSSGFKSYKENIGSLRNEGYELSLKAFIVRRNDLNINVYGSLVHNKNTIKKISNSLKNYNDSVDKEMNTEGKGTKTKVKFMEGQSTSSIYAVMSHGINPANGKELFINKNGTLTYLWDASQQVVCGDTEPLISGTIGANIDYKGFNLNFNFLYENGGDIYNQTLVDRVENANINWNVDKRVLNERWRESGDKAKFKSIKDRSITNVTSRFVEKNNILRLETVSLSYIFDRELTEKWGIERLKLGFLMNEVLRASTVKQERGLEYPFARSFNINLQIQF